MAEEDQKEQKKKRRIKNSEAAILLLMALIFDVLSLIPGANLVVVIVAQGLIALFFFLHGVNVFSGGYKKLVPYLVATLAEAIPFLSMIPMITFETLIIIAVSRTEDKVGVKITPESASKLANKGLPTPPVA